jgi:hypothetical protein
MKTPLSPTARDILTEKFHALLDECNVVSDNAAFGKTLDDLETFFLIQGRTFLKEVFQEQLQERIQQSEQHAEIKECSDCKKNTLRPYETQNNSLCPRSHYTDTPVSPLFSL